MKKSYYFIILSFIALALILLIKAKTDLTDVSVSVKIVDEFKNEENFDTITVCVLNSNNDYDLVDVKINKEKDIYLYIFELYNYRRNTLPIGFEVGSNYLLEVLSYQHKDNKISFELAESKIPEDEIISSIYMMMITYHFLDINEISLQIGSRYYNSKDYWVLK